MTLFEKVFSTPTLMQIIVVLTATVAMKALSVHYDFSWATCVYRKPYPSLSGNRIG
jgi:hypothetical protein